MRKKIAMTDQEWQAQLTPEQYQVMRRKGTERPFTGEYYKTKDKGIYRCAACGTALFSSDTKFESGSGWPSFWAPVDEDSVQIEEDHSHGMHRVEVLCATCAAHLGHVFEDGPQPTGQRFCMNSIALRLDTAGET
jgi:peptide-methionine (R)-S-oxide reductase